MKKFDVVVIGSGPAGEKAAVKAAYFGKKTALIEKENRYGGAGVHTGTLPSKTLKETALLFSGRYGNEFYGLDRETRNSISIDQFMRRKKSVSASQNLEVENNLFRHSVEVFRGTARFQNDHLIFVQGKTSEILYGENIIIASGSVPVHPAGIPFDNLRVHDSDTILNIEKIPDSLCIVGAGVIGCEYATIFAAVGTKVTVIGSGDEILPFLDWELSAALHEHMAVAGISVELGSGVESVEDYHGILRVRQKNARATDHEMFLYTAGRRANTAELNLAAAGIEPGERGLIVVNEKYQTAKPHIYAVGDVIGFPALASTSMDQGRAAVSHMFQLKDLDSLPKFIPFGIYTIPEVSMIGLGEVDAEQKGFDVLCGKAFYRDMPRGKIMGVTEGFLKLVFEKSTLRILGVHIIGQIASELIHFGGGLLQKEATLHDLIATVFNYPTLHDLYKYAAYDGLGKTKQI